MGLRLVQRAYAVMPHIRLTPDARNVLVFMALHARDDDDAPRYFMQRESTCVALGRLVPDAPEKDDPAAGDADRERRAAFQRLKVVIAELIAAGLLKRHRRGQRNQRAEYVLTIPTVTDLGTRDVPHAGTPDVPLEVRQTYPRRYARRTPKEEQESLGEKSEEQHHLKRASHVHPVEKSA